MNRRDLIIGASGLTAFAAYGYFRNTEQPAYADLSAISEEEHAQTIAGMKPPKRRRPIVAVLADNQGSETTDFIIPWSVLTRSDVADVYAVALDPGPVQLMPALKIAPQMTVGDFNAQFSDGADYVIVPAFHNPKSPKAGAWIKQQSRSGATIVGICAGALPLAHAGLLAHKYATTHWYSVGQMQRASPSTMWRQDRRYVADSGIITSTGVSASLPLSLALVEAIAGKGVSDLLAKSLGVDHYDERHNSEYYKLRSKTIYRAAMNSLNLLGHEKIVLPVAEDIDEMSLAFTADAWSRTYRSKCFTVADMPKIKTLNGLNIITDFNVKHAQGNVVPPPISNTPGDSLETVLGHIAERYGDETASFVALQLEYPWQGRSA